MDKVEDAFSVEDTVVEDATSVLDVAADEFEDAYSVEDMAVEDTAMLLDAAEDELEVGPPQDAVSLIASILCQLPL